MSEHTPALALKEAIRTASRGLVEREALVELVALAAVAREHVLVIGPPGTAKSEAVRRISRCLGGRYFEYLLGRFTEPNELFGPVDLQRLRAGVVETRTEGMLPEAELVFLDEVFLGSTAILNTLLAILNERVFRRGAQALPCPLRVCVGASNALPDDPALAAFADRFLLRMFLDKLPDPRLEELLAAGWEGTTPPVATASVQDIDALAEQARAVDLRPVRPHLAHAVRVLKAQGIALSDRRVVKLQGLVAAAAVLAGRAAPTRADLWPLIFAVPSAEAQAIARDTLRDLLEASDSPALPAAAEAASLGPAARARRLVEDGEAALAARPAAADEMAGWRLRLEAVLREIDAGFDPAARPESLAQLRTRLVAEVEPT
jgi:MoxR-like ATPase